MRKWLIALLALVALVAVAAVFLLRGQTAELPLAEVTGTEPTIAEPSPEKFPTVEVARPVGWGASEVPQAAAGLAVTRFASGLDHPRVIYTLPNGDVLVTLTNRPPGSGPKGIAGLVAKLLFARAGADVPSPDQLVLLRDSNGDGAADQRHVLRTELSSPSGIAWHDGTLYLANHDALLAFPYALGANRLDGAPRKLMDLPPGGNHWMRNIALNPEGTRIYVAVGSASNIAENGIEAEQGRARIWEYNLETRRQRPFATGLRNANGLDFNPWSGELWTTVNERDQLGSDLVPDYLTNVPVGAQYGWPWLYWGENVDRRVKAPMPAYLVEYSRTPEYALGPHVAALGLAFTKGGHLMGDRFASGAFIARHGSWNRKPAAGYDVVYVAFDERGNPTGTPVPVLSGFLKDNGDTRGRPTWVAWAGDGALLVSDDTAGIIWRVAAPGAQPGAAIERRATRALPPRPELSGDPRATFGEADYARRQPAQ